MKATFETINSVGDTSFVVRKFDRQNFEAPYHFHPEYELTLILKGYGKRYVGTHMADYAPHDLVLLGSNTPHCWKTENQEVQENSSSVVIQFHPNFMGVGFFNKPEMEKILLLLNNSSYGIKFNGDTAGFEDKMIVLLNESNSFKRLVLLLEILHEMALTNQYVLLNKQNLFAELPVNEKERINQVIAYIVENFRETISLNQAAVVANMTPQAFCKYFKKISRKTFIEAVTDYRIDYAMQELVHTDKPVTQIGFESGFNDISNFYKTFKDRLQLSPLNYRNGFVKKL